MASILGFLSRNYSIASPTPVPKTDQPLRFGLISCANIIPMAFLTPSLTHPDISITAIAARDVSKASLFAKKHHIPKVHATYQDLLDDADIDAVYIPLPNGLHYEWALKAIQAGKHVYLEKPAVSNAIEAEKLFRHPLLSQAGAPVVLLEAAHSWFHPAWQQFMAFVRSADIERADSNMMIPSGLIKEGDIRYDYSLAGGAMMDLGPYGLGSIRLAFGGGLPEECESIVWGDKDGKTDGDVDMKFEARFRFENGGIGVARGSLSHPLRNHEWPLLMVRHREEAFRGPDKFAKLGKDAGEVPTGIGRDDEKQKGAEERELVRTRTVTLSMFFTPHMYHTVSVKDDCMLRYFEGEKKGKVFKEWKMRKDYKAYSFRDVSGMESQAGEPHWATYRYCLEQFVNKVRGRETPQWFGAEDSIGMARMIDMAYEKAGMKLRPTSTYE